MEAVAIYLAKRNDFKTLLKLLQHGQGQITQDVYVHLFDIDGKILDEFYRSNADKNEIAFDWNLVIACYIILSEKFMLKPTLQSLVVLLESIYFLDQCIWNPKFQIVNSEDFLQKLFANFTIEELNADFTFPSKYQNLAHCIACNQPDYLMLFPGDIYITVNGKTLLDYAIESQYLSMVMLENLILSDLDISDSTFDFLEREKLTIQMQTIQSLII